MSTIFEQLSKLNVQRSREVFHSEDWTPTDFATELGGEVGEALNFVKKMRRLVDKDWTTPNHQHVYDKFQRLSDACRLELADVVICTSLLALRLGIDLAPAVVEKFNQDSDKKGSDIKLVAEESLEQLIERLPDDESGYYYGIVRVGYNWECHKSSSDRDYVSHTVHATAIGAVKAMLKLEGVV